jgi:hypothetical protein
LRQRFSSSELSSFSFLSCSSSRLLYSSRGKAISVSEYPVSVRPAEVEIDAAL